jgi:hypothetical protein
MNIKVLHVLGGQAFIGKVNFAGDYIEVSQPYEVFVTPPTSANENGTVTLVAAATLCGLLTHPETIRINNSIIFHVDSPPQHLLDHYKEVINAL